MQSPKPEPSNDDLSDDAASEAKYVPENPKDSISDTPQHQESPATSAPDDSDKSRAAAASAGSGNQSSDSET